MPTIPRLPRLPQIPERPAPVDLGDRPRICVIKLATLGDLLLATPAIRALRDRYPEATIDILTTPAAAGLLQDSQLVRRIFALDKYAFDKPTQLLQNLRPTFAASSLLGRLRKEHYDAALLLHHLTLARSRVKSWALLRAIAPTTSIGLDNGWGGFLDRRVPDNGFGIRHEAEYALEVARAAGAVIGQGAYPLRAADLGWNELVTPSHPRAAVRTVTPLHWWRCTPVAGATAWPDAGQPSATASWRRPFTANSARAFC